MALPFLKNKLQQENVRVTETSSNNPQSLPVSLVLCCGPGGGLSIGRITTNVSDDGTRIQTLDRNYIPLSMWNRANKAKVPKFQGEASCRKNVEADTNLRLCQANVRANNRPHNRSVVLALPAAAAAAHNLKGKEPMQQQQQPANNNEPEPEPEPEPESVFIDCIHCNAHFPVLVHMPYPKCLSCRRINYLPNGFLNFSRKRARMI